VVAGKATPGFSGDNNPATSAQLSAGIPWVDSIGDIYIPEDFNHRIRKVNRFGIITTFGGTGSESTLGLSGPIASVSFHSPYSIVGDTLGAYLYISDQYYVWKYSFISNNVSTFAHASLAPGFSGDDGPASNARLNEPKGLWLTTSGDLYIADCGNHRVRKVTPSGIITTVAGSGPGSDLGDDGPATDAKLSSPTGVYVDSNGYLFIADSDTYSIRIVNTNQNITTFAGSGINVYFDGDNIPATSASISPVDVKGDTLGNIFIADYVNCIIRMIDATTRLISTVFGSPGICGFTAGISDKSSPLNSPIGLWLDSLSRIYFSDSNSVRRRITVSDPVSYSLIFKALVAGTDTVDFSGDNGPATAAELQSGLLWVDFNRNIYLPDDHNYRIRKVDIAGIITTFAGTGSSSTAGVSGVSNSVSFFLPWSIVGNSAGTLLYLTDQQYVWKYSFSSDTFVVIAGTAVSGFSVENGPATSVQLNTPKGLWLTTSEDLYVADYKNHRIRKVSASIVATVVGTGTCGGMGCIAGLIGDNGPAFSAKLNKPLSVYMSTNGILFIADSQNYRIRMVDTNQIITTFAGSGVATPFNGENIDATSANINIPSDVKGDSLGNIFIADFNNCIIRMVDASTRLISTVFGSPGNMGFVARLSDRTSLIGSPIGLWVDSLSRIYFRDSSAVHRSAIVSQPTSQPTSQPIAVPSSQPTRKPTGQPTTSVPTRPKLTSTIGFMELVTGTNSSGYFGDNGPATVAQMKSRVPWVDSNGTVYISDCENYRVRKVDAAGIITTFAGTGITSTAGISANRTSVSFFSPWSIVGDSLGTLLYISDQRYIWKYQFSTNIVSTFAGTTTSGFSGDNSPTNLAQLNEPKGLLLTSSGILYVADTKNHRIRMIASGIITTVAGSSSTGSYNGDNILATSSTLNLPNAVYVDTNGRMFISDSFNLRIRLVNTNNIITTFAGTGAATPFTDNCPASSARIGKPRDVKGDIYGNILIAEDHSIIRVVDISGIISTLFGIPDVSGFTAGIAARSRSINAPYGIWIDSSRTIYFSDINSIHRSIIVSAPSSQPTGHPTKAPSRPFPSDVLFMKLMAGKASTGTGGDGNAATLAQLTSRIPWVASNGAVYIADETAHKIRKVDIAGIITRFAGTGTSSLAGTSEILASVSFFIPWCVIGDLPGTILYVSDRKYIWKYEFSTNIVSVFTGTSLSGFTGDGGAVSSAQINEPRGMWLTTSGDLYFADYGNHKIRKISTGIIVTVAGVPSDNIGGYNGDNIQSIFAQLSFPNAVYVDTNGRMFISDSHNFRIRFIDTDNIITTFAGTGVDVSLPITDNLPASLSPIGATEDVKGDSLGNIYIAERSKRIIRVIDTHGILSILFGIPGVSGFPTEIAPRSSGLKDPSGLWIDSIGTIYFSDYSSIHQSVLVSQPTSQPSRQPTSQPTADPLSTLYVQLVAGTSSPGFDGDDGPATSAEITAIIPYVDSNGDIYLPDDDNCRIRKVSKAAHTITTFAGTGSQSTAGTSALKSAVGFYVPYSIVGDTAGTFLLVSDMFYVWKINLNSGMASVYAGFTSLAPGFSGDNGPATSAQLYNPMGLWLTTSGDLYIADRSNHRIRKVSYSLTLTSNIIATVAGTGNNGFSGDAGLASLGILTNPRSVYTDTNGNVYIADSGNNRIRLVNTYNIITTFAGTGVQNPFNGEKIAATSANINQPYDVKGDSLGNIYIADWGHNIISMIDTNRIITTLFGTPNSNGFAPGTSTRSAPMSSPYGIWVDSLANI
jgi:sugar lactone lactonase YvrE